MNTKKPAVNHVGTSLILVVLIILALVILDRIFTDTDDHIRMVDVIDPDVRQCEHPAHARGHHLLPFPGQTENHVPAQFGQIRGAGNQLVHYLELIPAVKGHH